MNEWTWGIAGNILTGRNRNTRRGTHANAASSTTNPTHFWYHYGDHSREQDTDWDCSSGGWGQKIYSLDTGENSLECLTKPVKLLVVRHLDLVYNFKSYTLKHVLILSFLLSLIISSSLLPSHLPSKISYTFLVIKWVTALTSPPQGRSGQVRKISPPPRFDPRTAVPTVSRYTDWAIPAPI